MAKALREVAVSSKLSEIRERLEDNAYVKKDILDEYEKINPKLASLRKEEKEKVEEGMNPKQAQKERREAVKAYYNKKSGKEK